VKLLVDTSVWSLALRRKDPESLSAEERKLRGQLAQAVQNGRVSIIGPIRQELLSGIKEQAQFDKLKNHLDAFLDEPLETADFVHAARLHNGCKTHGVETGTVDILICAVAIRRNWQVLSNDKGLERCWEIAQTPQKSGETSATPGRRKATRKAGGRR